MQVRVRSTRGAVGPGEQPLHRQHQQGGQGGNIQQQGSVVVVYHLTILANGHGGKFSTILIGHVLRTARICL